MIAYNFKTEFAPGVEAGRKLLTLRRTRKPPSRHAGAGEPIGLWTGLRTTTARRVGVGVVTLRALVRFDEGGIVAVSEVRVATPALDQTEALQRELLDRENDVFAARDGFANWAALWSWHDAARSKDEAARPPHDRSLVRELVAWRLLSAEHAAALDNGAPLEDAA